MLVKGECLPGLQGPSQPDLPDPPDWQKNIIDLGRQRAVMASSRGQRLPAYRHLHKPSLVSKLNRCPHSLPKYFLK